MGPKNGPIFGPLFGSENAPLFQTKLSPAPSARLVLGEELFWPIGVARTGADVAGICWPTRSALAPDVLTSSGNTWPGCRVLLRATARLEREPTAAWPGRRRERWPCPLYPSDASHE